jgi:carboxymethylenebutenolidase
VGVVGFCMGGSLALWAGALADEVKVAVGFYPAIPWEKMAPSWGNYANKTAMLHASEEDGTSKAPGIQAAVKGIEEAGGTVEVYDYPGTKHAFFNDQRPEVHSKEHSEAAWRRTVDLFSSRL